MSFMNDAGADCGPVNPMAGLMKQFGQDRSLQQDRFGLESRGESSKSGFRSRNTIPSAVQGSQMADEFFRDEMNSQVNHAFQFNGMSRELERLQQPQRSNDWLTDFKQHQSIMEPTEQFKEFEMIYQQNQKAPLHSVNWSNEFKTYQAEAPLNPIEHEAFERAFEEAKQKTRSWEAEFAAQENDWTAEFEQQQEKENIVASTDNEALAKTAGLLLDSVDVNSNPKFKNSQFMNLMRKLRDSEVAIQGDKMVETKSGHDWASEFKQQDWTSEFKQHSTNQPGQMWSQEFANKLERNWTDEFHHEQKQHQLPGDWANEFQKNSELQNLFGKGTESEDWVEQYNRNIAHLKEAQDHEWDAMQKDWEQFQPNQGYRAMNPEYNTYNFSTNNPYLLNPAMIDQGIASDHLADAILALEAKTQLQTSNADAWQSLGLRQQENERDGAAIAALRQALNMNPQLLDGWLALAVSYTNENCRADAYDALEQWIAHHEHYKHLIQTSSPNTPDGRHAYITQLFLQAARSSPGEQMDPDVQVGLGVLFNVSEEYDKAIDCFKAALASRPRDYLLWNKLGATLANSRNPTGAIDAYFNALEISPTYIRARYNLAISCINLGQQQEAAEHLLTALALQKSNDGSNGAGGNVIVDEKGNTVHIPGGMSDNIWSSLRMLMSSMSRDDLARECDRHNLDAFRSSFEF